MLTVGRVAASCALVGDDRGTARTCATAPAGWATGRAGRRSGLTILLVAFIWSVGTRSVSGVATIGASSTSGVSNTRAGQIRGVAVCSAARGPVT